MVHLMDLVMSSSTMENGTCKNVSTPTIKLVIAQD
ncbi:hypothetical protein A2U01_0114111, partial [Trifolium medium]|nr:hypothetical protein [Trifolium medium]